MQEKRLFSPLKVGNVNLHHRVVLPPLTRFRADDNHIPLDICVEYYAQRASTPGTLLIAEATLVSPRAAGLDNVTGIWTAEHIAAWKKVTDAVHAKQCFIFLQLWDLGRKACPESLEREQGGPYTVSSASAVDIRPVKPVEGGRHLPPAKTHILTEDEIQTRIKDFAIAAQNAVEAGFDGVEVHGANGYLVDQFLQVESNSRSDKYGGSIDKRSRFCVEVIKAIIDAIGDSKKVAVRLSPWTEAESNGAENPIPQFLHVISELKKLGLAYLHLVESRISGDSSTAVYHELTRRNDELIEMWGDQGVIILAGGFTPETAMVATDKIYKHQNICIAIGRYYLSTPDLPFRAQHDLPLNPYHRPTFYERMSPNGYTDYPYSKEYLALDGTKSSSTVVQTPS